VVCQRHRIHSKLTAPAQQLIERDSPIQKRILAVQVQVRKSVTTHRFDPSFSANPFTFAIIPNRAYNVKALDERTRKMQTKTSTFSILKYSVIIFLVFFAGCPNPSRKTPNQPDEPHFTEIKTTDTYVHNPTGMQFPTEVAGFKRVKVTQYDRTGSNVSAEYTLDYFGFKIAEVRVYIYPVETNPGFGPMTLEKHYDELRALLFNIYTDAHDLEDGEIKIGQPFGPQRGLMFKFTYHPPDMFDSKPCYAKLYLFKYGPWFIKYRVTNPVKEDVKVELEFQKFLQMLTWPQLPYTDANQPANIAPITPDVNFY
jgi:hypothetical protein